MTFFLSRVVLQIAILFTGKRSQGVPAGDNATAEALRCLIQFILK